MATTIDQPPLLPELPLGVGLGFLVMAGASSFSPSEDRLFLVGFCAAVGLLLVATATALSWQRYGSPPAAAPEGDHGRPGP